MNYWPSRNHFLANLLSRCLERGARVLSSDLMVVAQLFFEEVSKQKIEWCSSKCNRGLSVNKVRHLSACFDVAQQAVQYRHMASLRRFGWLKPGSVNMVDCRLHARLLDGFLATFHVVNNRKYCR